MRHSRIRRCYRTAIAFPGHAHLTFCRNEALTGLPIVRAGSPRHVLAQIAHRLCLKLSRHPNLHSHPLILAWLTQGERAFNLFSVGSLYAQISTLGTSSTWRG